MITLQRKICHDYGSPFQPPSAEESCGIAFNATDLNDVLHGLRHEPEGGSCGWYIWRGTYSEDPSFFSPVCVEHMSEHAADATKFLGLAPGWRFLVHNDHEDVWFDPSLLFADKSS